jgi:hypothetical protein
VRGPFFDSVISTDGGGSHNVSQYGVAESFFKELDAFWASKSVSRLSRQFFELGYIRIYVIIFKLELGDLCSGSILSYGVEVLDFKFLKKEVP